MSLNRVSQNKLLKILTKFLCFARGKLICGLTSTGEDTERLGAGILQLKMEDSNTVLSCGYDTTVRLWDLRLR